ncbi:MAG: hypothetical protein ACRC6V_07785, partial [Bacteroidales bacterium]
MAVNVNTGFDNDERLLDIRTVVLNPIAVKVAGLENKVITMEGQVGSSLKGAVVDTNAKTITFPKVTGAPEVADLTGMFGEGSSLEVVDFKGTSFKNISKLDFIDAEILNHTSGEAEVHYPFDKIVPQHQNKLLVGKTGSTAGLGYKSDALFFKGKGVTIDNVDPFITTVTIADPTPPLLASIHGGSAPAPITEVILEGDTAASHVTGGKLTINLNSGGGTPLASQNFLGFFATLGDLQSAVPNPFDGKSFAFVKDSKLGGPYYTPYFYVNGAWNELKQDPALTYSGPKDPMTHGVFSIKPSEKITVDHLGQLDLDGLSAPADPKFFHGFYDDVNQLKIAVPNPTLDLSFAYVKHLSGSGWEGLRYVAHGSSSRKWETVAAVGGFSVIDKKVGPTRSSAGFGIYQNDDFDMDAKGILSLKPIDTTTDVVISDGKGDTTGGKVNAIRFENGKPYAQVDGTILTIKSPQQLIAYDSTWERAHPLEDYRGSLFYDITSRSWMGCDDPTAGGAVDVKWTHLLHRNMSNEVKDLVKRVPAKTPDVLPGVLGDHADWAYNGVTYIEQGSEHLPEEFKDRCGGYITTTVNDKDQPGVTIPQHRIQTCTPDRETGGTWVRRFKSTGSPGGQTGWSDWVRTSFSHKDIENHMEDKNAHKSVIKFYKAASFAAQYSNFYNQSVGGAGGGVRGGNCSLMVDNYGARGEDQDYMCPAYDGDFRVRGVLAFAGYSDKNIPVGQWNVTVRLKHKDSSAWRTIGHFRSKEMAASSKKFPLISFETSPEEILSTDEIVINVTYTNTSSLITDHPGLYFVPLRSHFVLEDENTRAGTNIARTFGKYAGNVDIVGDVGVRVHYTNIPNSTGAIRVYGEAL